MVGERELRFLKHYFKLSRLKNACIRPPTKLLNIIGNYGADRVKIESMGSMKLFLLIIPLFFTSIPINQLRSIESPNSHEGEPLPLPYVWDSGIACHYLDLDVLSEGYQQSITVKTRDLIIVEIKFQKWSVNDANELNQVFLLFSWSNVWEPPTHYLPLWFGFSGKYPGVIRVWRFSIRAPSKPGTYYIWIRGDCAGTMEEAVANIWRRYRGPPPYNDDGGGVIGKITVEPKFYSQTQVISDLIFIVAVVAVLLLAFMATYKRVAKD